MGCNSHTYIEYRRKSDAEQGNNYWWSLLNHSVDSRNYALYAKMAGVRNYHDAITPISNWRGFPEDASDVAKSEYYYLIDDQGYEKGWDHCVSSKQAAEWVASGAATFPLDGSNRVSGPDWHSPSYLTGEEFLTAVREVASDDVYWTAIAAMVENVMQRAAYEVRVVFWFDN